MINKLKQPFRVVRSRWRYLQLSAYLAKLIQNQPSFQNFDFEIFKQNILRFSDSLRLGQEAHLYRYSDSCTAPTLYASAYACMTHSMLRALPSFDKEQISYWIDYFDSFQSPNDGLFCDPVIENEIYAESDWWGSRHLALHMISAYTALGEKPKHPFHFLRKYYSADAISNWLNLYNWSSAEIGREDPDNKIMNIGCLLQYQRDTWDDREAGAAVQHLKDSLRKKLNRETGMWGGFDIANPHERSRMVQFAYHLFPIFFYDKEFDFDAEKIVSITLSTQNRFGGFGVQPNSSACEDIDSIDLLIRLYPFMSEQLQAEINASLAKAFNWALLNQVDDGGFVFRLNEAFRYGSDNTSSLPNEGAMLPTWFRTLSLAYMARFLGLANNFVITRCPGYEF